MKIVWRLGTSTVRQVYETARDARSVAYTTIMTMMGILEQKGFLKKTLVNRTHVFKPAKSRHQVLGAMVRDFVDRVFDGAPDGLLLHLAKDNALTDEQRRAIRKLLEEERE